MAFSHATDTYKNAVKFVILIIGVLYAFHSCVKMQYQTTSNERTSADDYSHENGWKQAQLTACLLPGLYYKCPASTIGPIVVLASLLLLHLVAFATRIRKLTGLELANFCLFFSMFVVVMSPQLNDHDNEARTCLS